MNLFRWLADGIRLVRQRRREKAVLRDEARRLRRKVEEAVSTTEPRIRLVRDYEERLAPAVKKALEYCRGLAEEIPGPFDVRPGQWGDDPQVTAYFATVAEAEAALGTCSELRRYFHERPAADAVAFLTMAPEEKQVYGTSVNGDLVRRDVRRISLNFSRHRFTSPAATAELLREELRQRAFRFLLTCALENIAALETREEQLEHEHDILEVQWRLQKSRETGLEPLVSHAAAAPRTEGASRVLAEIHEQLTAVRSKLDDPSDYLAHLSQVLENPTHYLRVATASPRLDRMGMRVKAADADPGHPIPYGEIILGPEGQTLAAVVARVFRSDVEGSERREGL
jgi:hypothetical protein